MQMRSEQLSKILFSWLGRLKCCCLGSGDNLDHDLLGSTALITPKNQKTNVLCTPRHQIWNHRNFFLVLNYTPATASQSGLIHFCCSSPSSGNGYWGGDGGNVVTTGVDIILLLSSWHQALHWLGRRTGDLDACCQHGATSARVTGGLELVSGLVCLSTVSLNLMWDNSIPASFAHYYSQCSEYPLWCKSVGQTGGERGELVSTYPALPSTTQQYLDRPTTNGRSAGHSPGRLAQLCVTTRGGGGGVRGRDWDLGEESQPERRDGTVAHSPV